MSRLGSKKVSRRSLSKMPGVQSYAEISKRFKQTREEAEITQEVMATSLGITISCVKAIETGRMIPNIYIIRQWQKVYKRSYSWIIDGAVQKKAAP